MHLTAAYYSIFRVLKTRVTTFKKYSSKGFKERNPAFLKDTKSEKR